MGTNTNHKKKWSSLRRSCLAIAGLGVLRTANSY